MVGEPLQYTCKDGTFTALTVQINSFFKCLYIQGWFCGPSLARLCFLKATYRGGPAPASLSVVRQQVFVLIEMGNKVMRDGQEGLTLVLHR